MTRKLEELTRNNGKSQALRALTADWNGYFRLRVGDVRVIVRLDYVFLEITVYRVAYRGKAYG